MEDGLDIEWLAFQPTCETRTRRSWSADAIFESLDEGVVDKVLFAATRLRTFFQQVIAGAIHVSPIAIDEVGRAFNHRSEFGALTVLRYEMECGAQGRKTGVARE